MANDREVGEMSSRREGDRTHLVQSILNTIGVEGGTHISFFSTDLMLVKTSWGGGRISPANSVGQRMFQHSTKFTDWARIRILGKRGLWVQLFHSLFSWHSALAHTLSEDGGYHLILFACCNSSSLLRHTHPRPYLSRQKLC